MKNSLPTGWKRVLFIDSTHIGSLYSPMPSCVYTSDDPSKAQEIYPSPTQKKLNTLWNSRVHDVGRVDACVHCGETCDGVNRKEEGRDIWTSDKNVQVQAAIDMLIKIKAKEYKFIEGSAYHTGVNLTLDHAVARAFGETCYSNLALTVNDVRFHIQHKIGVTRTAYKGTQLAAERLYAEINKDEYGHFDVIVRGHAHYFWFNGSANQMGVTLPCWKLRDRFVSRRSLAWNPSIGYVIFDIPPAGKDYLFGYDVHRLKGVDLIPEVCIKNKNKPRGGKRHEKGKGEAKRS